jgi:hypothetical protein
MGSFRQIAQILCRWVRFAERRCISGRCRPGFPVHFLNPRTFRNAAPLRQEARCQDQFLLLAITSANSLRARSREDRALRS